jgi:hypothetical protein
MTVDAESDLPDVVENDAPEAEHDAPRLALGRTVMVAYDFVLSNPGRFLFLAMVPLAGLCSGELLAGLWSGETSAILAQPGAPETDVLYFELVFALELGFASVFSLLWHRLMLVGSATSGIDALGLVLRGLRFYGYCILMVLLRKAFMLGAGWVLAFGTLAVIINGGFGIIKPLLRRAFKTPSGAVFAVFLIACGAWYYTNPSRATTDVIEQALAIVMLVPFARVLLALPAVAMGERGDLIAGAWHHSRGNGVQLCLGLALCVGPFESARWAIRQTLDMLHSGGSAMVVAALLSSLLLLLEIAVVTSFLCASYRQLAGAGGTIGVVPPDAKARRPAPVNRLR